MSNQQTARKIATAAARETVEQLHNVGNLRDANATVAQISAATEQLAIAQAEYERAENATYDAGE